MQAVLILFPFERGEWIFQMAEGSLAGNTEIHMQLLADLYGNQQRAQRFKLCFHNRFKKGIGRRCLLNGKLPVPLDERRSLRAVQAEIFRRLVQAEPQLLHGN